MGLVRTKRAWKARRRLGRADGARRARRTDDAVARQVGEEANARNHILIRVRAAWARLRRARALDAKISSRTVAARSVAAIPSTAHMYLYVVVGWIEYYHTAPVSKDLRTKNGFVYVTPIARSSANLVNHTLVIVSVFLVLGTDLTMRQS